MTKSISISFIVRIILLIALTASFVQFETFYKQREIIRNMAYGLNTFLTASVLISIGHFILVKLYNSRNEQQVVRGNFVLGITRVATVGNVFFIIVSLMIAVGINPKDFITSMTIVAMAIAVIFREYITNMISGLIIMFSDQFSVGDRIKIGEYQGKIVDITLANLVVRDEDDDAVMIPNNLVFTATLVNKTSQKSNKIVVKFELPIDRSFAVAELEQYLSPLLQKNPNLDHSQGFTIKVADMTKDYIKYKVEVSAISSSNKVHQQVQSSILNEILQFTRL
ncbi:MULTISPECIES: mechanosensitive ion channel family protein [Sphingobacterium]|uniref:Small conductance mechanosensitive ion channel family transporter n=1 Tax=Sphingobacterium multivorum TaxID=28454 RepID=A0A654DKU5_SPHMU|nr:MULTISPECIES: mechanosensitive ion channel domain-containing protein [Sphingobacterium]HAE66112.1 small conductance mechanosensitive ion channel family transporter [Sphingobacterium sp.]OFV10560.1 small conductance mechanosensitive ion channel family transporter [Sphingobacterium sp. HMSC13C05]QQT45934.1 mechanosensitive ion channel [Sphingobacterium multivorum]QQT61426.1 mechanosensitive ion channel [Sphingobacterium multivorum]SUJ29287.1 Small-conductance mechanosensitive channel [Sphingo